ncbi:hypothetical protein H6771_02965 [Candidatus Peribacteria bacterium]|nr:hypothetical protein [Candidatus Peribacteria bacterium]
MNLSDIFSPLRRHRAAVLVMTLVLGLGLFALLVWALPSVQRLTLYATVQPLGEEANTTHYYAAEGAERMAETMVGWVKDPAFREEIQRAAGVAIPDMKRKLSARKQNRANVFFTLKIPAEIATSDTALAKALETGLEESLSGYSVAASADYGLFAVRTYSEPWSIPQRWLAITALFMALVLSILLVYLWELWRGVVSYLWQVEALFPLSPVLQVHTPADGELLPAFMNQFASPRLIGTPPKWHSQWELHTLDSLDAEGDTPVIVVELGRTRLQEVANLRSICGEDAGVVVVG